MKINRPIVIVAVIYNLINFLLRQCLYSSSSADSVAYLFIFPCFWIFAIVVVVVLSLRNKETWFSKKYFVSTGIALLFCTPIPFFTTLQWLDKSDSYLTSTMYISDKGYTLKHESWFYYNGSLEVVKYWKADKENCQSCASSLFKKDSAWVYFNRRKDTLKIETYKNDKLIKLKTF